MSQIAQERALTEFVDALIRHGFVQRDELAGVKKITLVATADGLEVTIDRAPDRLLVAALQDWHSE